MCGGIVSPVDKGLRLLHGEQSGESIFSVVLPGVKPGFSLAFIWTMFERAMWQMMDLSDITKSFDLSRSKHVSFCSLVDVSNMKPDRRIEAVSSCDTHTARSIISMRSHQSYGEYQDSGRA